MIAIAALALCACGRTEAPSNAADTTPAAPAATPPEPTTAPTAEFINKVWQVHASSAVAPGALCVFLSEGTLVITSSNGTPMVGKWQRQDGQLTMVEEGLAYPTDILELTPDRFRIRSHNPGEPVDIDLVPAGSPAK